MEIQAGKKQQQDLKNELQNGKEERDKLAETAT